MANPILTRCPVCGQELTVERLRCQGCGTGVDGSFQLDNFSRLSPQQRAFAEVFLRCSGNIKEVERELGISYPTVRNRLGEVVAALGYPARANPDGQREAILGQLARGEITQEEALEAITNL
ncbi:MAG: DUF2089 domain-containing protein [Christensenellales bacterium]|jgi:hypothetical protein